MRRLLVILLLWPAAGGGQAVGPAGPGGAPPAASRFEDLAPPPPLEVLRSPAGAFAASLVVPGAGQAALGLRRWVVYGLLEAALWGVHLEAAADVRRLSTAYRDLAWQAARLPTAPGGRVDGGWGYYETMSQYVASGAYDQDPMAPGVQPEEDASTYNGTVWELARGLFLPGGTVDPSSPEYEVALDYYADRAAGPDFLWSWEGRLDDMARFNDLIGDADREARVRSTALGVLLANHLVSAVDALVVARLRTGDAVRLESRITPAPHAPGWAVGLRIMLPN